MFVWWCISYILCFLVTAFIIFGALTWLPLGLIWAGWGDEPLGDNFPPPPPPPPPPPELPLSSSIPPCGVACGRRDPDPGAGSPPPSPPLPSLGVTGGAGILGRLGSHDTSHAPFRFCCWCCCVLAIPPPGWRGATWAISLEGWGWWWLMGSWGERLRLRGLGVGEGECWLFGAGWWLLGVDGWPAGDRNPGLGGLSAV